MEKYTGFPTAYLLAVAVLFIAVLFWRKEKITNRSLALTGCGVGLVSLLTFINEIGG